MSSTKNFLILFSVFLFCFGCKPTTKEKMLIVQNAPYESFIIKNLHKYTYLRSLLIENLDTIIKFQNKKNMVTFIGKGGGGDSIAQVNEDCWTFFDGNNRYDITNVPSFIASKLDSVWIDLGKDGISNITICKDGRIEIVVTGYYNYDNTDLILSHSLSYTKFNNKKIRNELFEKDTTIGNDWIYEIGLYEPASW